MDRLDERENLIRFKLRSASPFCPLGTRLTVEGSKDVSHPCNTRNAV